MKVKKIISLSKATLVFFAMLFISKIAICQTDSTVTTVVKNDSTVAKIDTTVTNPETEKKKKKKGNGFVAYGAVTFNQLSMNSSYESVTAPGWALGVSYKRGNFLYWGVGARYNNAIYEVHLTGQTPDSVADNLVSVSDIDIPITLGVNLLSVTEKFLGLRVFVSAVPAYAFNVGTNGYKTLNKDNLNNFNFYGQAGVGIDILFLAIEAGYNYGFTDVFKTTESKPGQVFVNLGFRF